MKRLLELMYFRKPKQAVKFLDYPDKEGWYWFFDYDCLIADRPKIYYCCPDASQNGNCSYEQSAQFDCIAGHPLSESNFDSFRGKLVFIEPPKFTDQNTL